MLANSVEILLKPQNTLHRTLPNGIAGAIENEYAAKYLELIGVNPTRENVEFVLNNLPINDALLLPIWAKESLIILPGMAKKSKEASAIVMEMFGINSEDHPQKTARKNEDGSNAVDNASMTSTLEDGSMNDSSFAKIKKKATPEGRRVSWCTVETLTSLEPFTKRLPHHLFNNEHFANLIRLPIFDETVVTKPLVKFTTSLVDYIPRVKEDRTGKVFDSVNRMLASKQCMKLYSTLVHFLFWTVIYPFGKEVKSQIDNNQRLKQIRKGMETTEFPALNTDTAFSASINKRTTFAGKISNTENENNMESTMSASIDKELLFLQLEECLITLQRKLGFSKYALVTGHQALISCCHFVVDSVIEKVFPWFVTSKKLQELQLRQRQREEKLREQAAAQGSFLPNTATMGNKTTSLTDFLSNFQNNMATQQLPAQPTFPEDVEALDTLKLETRRLLHQVMSDILDPSRMYTSTWLEASLLGPPSTALKAPRSRLFCTSSAVQVALQGSVSANTRQFLSRSQSHYVQLPGIQKQPIVAALNKEEGKKSTQSKGEVRWADQVVQDEIVDEIAMDDGDKEYFHFETEKSVKKTIRNRKHHMIKSKSAVLDNVMKRLEDNISTMNTPPETTMVSSKSATQLKIDFKHLFSQSDEFHRNSDMTFDDENNQPERGTEIAKASPIRKKITSNAVQSTHMTLEAQTSLLKLVIDRASSHYSDEKKTHGRSSNVKDRANLLRGK